MELETALGVAVEEIAERADDEDDDDDDRCNGWGYHRCLRRRGR
jgi:hypothetical protein